MLPRRRCGVDLSRFAPTARSLAVAAVLALAVAGSYWLARSTSVFAVTSIEVTGAPPPLAAQVRATLASERGTSLLALDGSEVIDRLRALPAVRAASYDRSFPHTLSLRVEPEVAVAVLRRGGESWLASSDGRVIAEVPRGAAPRLPRIWLGSSKTVRLGERLTDPAGALASRALASFRGAGLEERVSFVRVDGGRLLARFLTGLEIRFGPPVDLPLKLAIASEILPQLAPPAAGGPRYLDVAVPERPVAGLNPQPEG